MKKRLYTILEVIFIAIFVFALYELIKIGISYYRGDQIYSEAQSKVEESTEDDTYHFEVDLKELQKINPDIVGWIKIPDTPIDYPLLQPDNNQYYLKHTYDNVYSDFGSIFIDCYCTMDDQNTVIYGHNTRNDSMFGSLKKYKDDDYLAAHPYVYVLYGDVEKQYEIVDRKTVEVTDSVYNTKFDDKELENDKFITLSTCTSRTMTERFVIVAKEVKDVWAK
ncbi:MAG: class B sortase [Clostridia bacterium]|nr:class B sortase [Clostridia bacterium]